jgi:hypothetical protein
MRSKLAFSTLALGFTLVGTALTPASAQYYRPAYGPRYYGPGPYVSVYPPAVVPGPYYDRGPIIAPPFYGDGWVPESIYQHSTPGGIDPYIRPPGS